MWWVMRASWVLVNGCKQECRMTVQLFREQDLLLSNRRDAVWLMIWSVPEAVWSPTYSPVHQQSHTSTYIMHKHTLLWSLCLLHSCLQLHWSLYCTSQPVFVLHLSVFMHEWLRYFYIYLCKLQTSLGGKNTANSRLKATQVEIRRAVTEPFSQPPRETGRQRG